MKVINSHKRIINQPKANVSKLFETLGTTEDKIWPSKNWPAMRFNDGFKIGSKGGHGIIRYTIIELKPGHHVTFEFRKPEGFIGTHELHVERISDHQSEISHLIKMNITSNAIISWVFIIRWLHDALIEEAFDNVENYFSKTHKKTTYSFWVKALRAYFKRKSDQRQQNN